MTSDNSIQNWIDAKELFEKYLDHPISQSLQDVNNDSSIPETVKSILINLIESQSSDDTIIDQADLSFFQSIDKKTEDLSGRSIAGYRLIERIGEGGMSNVYKAKRKGNDIQKFVALKLLTSVEGGISDTLKILFEREQITLSKLNHPNIISFHHGGISQNNTPFLVMDYIDEAQTINQYAIKKNLSTKEILILVKQVADAINYAHQNFIIHKDIKPNNVLIDGLGIPKVVDFGIASLDELETSQPSNLTAQIYTPDYASPEQIKNENITANTDVFSLAALLLEMLTKEKPLPKYDGNNIDEEKYDQHINGLLSQSNVDTDLSYILKKALTVNKRDRYPTIIGFVEDLDAFLENKPISARKQTKAYLVSKYINRNPAFTLAILAFTISAIIGVISTVQQKNKAQLEAFKAQQVTDFLIDSLQVNDPDINQGKEITVKELLLNAKINIQETSLQDKSISSALEQTIGSALAKIGQFNEAEKLLTHAITSDEKNFDAIISLAYLYFNQQYFDKTQTLLDELSDRNINLNQDQTVLIKQLEAELLFHNGSFDDAIRTITGVINKSDINTKQLIDSQFIYARFINEMGNPEKSVDILYQALKLSNKAYSETSTSSTNILFRIASAYSDFNPLPQEKMHQVYEQTINNQIVIYGDNHPYLAKTYLQYGFALKTFGDIENAKEFAHKAIKIALSNFGENHMLTARINILFSQLNFIENNLKAAIPELEGAVKVYESQYGVNHYETNQIKTTLAGYYLRAGLGDKALKMLQPLYQKQKQQLGEENKATIYVKLNIIKAHTLNGQHQIAVDEGTQLLSLSQKALGKDGILTVGVQIALTESYLNVNKYNESIELSEELLTFSLVKNNPRYKQRVEELLDLAIKMKQKNE